MAAELLTCSDCGTRLGAKTDSIITLDAGKHAATARHVSITLVSGRKIYQIVASCPSCGNGLTWEAVTIRFDI